MFINNIATGNTATDTIYLYVDPIPGHTIPSDVDICNGDSTFLVITGLSATDTVVWDPSPNLIKISEDSALVFPSSSTLFNANVYTTTITNGQTRLSCAQPFSVNVDVLTPVTTNISATSINCNGDFGTITVNAVGSGTLSYSWTGGNSATFSTSQDIISSAQAGNYQVTVSDLTGCDAVTAITLTEPSALTVSMSSSNPSCAGATDGTLSATVSGGTGTPTYLWNTGDTNSSLSGFAAGLYCVTATDQNGCVESNCVTLVDPAAISLSTSQNNIDCHGVADGDATANASGGAGSFNYQWDSFAGAQTSSTATGLAAGIYCVTVSDANTCTASTCVTITEPSAITVSNVTLNDPSCAGFNDGDATVNASGGASGFTYLWDVSTGGQTGATATGLTAGVYCVTAVDANTCTALHCVTLSDPSGITVSTTTTNDPSCFGLTDGDATVSVIGGAGSPYTFLWDAGAQTNATATGLAGGVHCVTVTDGNSCSVSHCVTLSAPSASTITINSNDPSCWGLNDGDATVSASGGAGGHSFLWDSGATNATLTNLSSGTYCVTATDVNGCEDTACITLINPAIISLSTSQNNIDCHGVADGDATANASGGAGGFSYQWDSFAGAQTSSTATGLAAGIYCVTVSDANTCTASTCVTITEPSAITVSNVTLNDPSCAGFNDGDATVNASGGASGFSYLWDVSTGGQTGATATGLSAGIYCVTAVDANTCTALHCVTLSDPSGITVSTTATNDPSCFGLTDGDATVSAIGGAGSPYTFLWDAGAQTNATATGLAGGVHCVTVTDGNSCSVSHCVTLSAPSASTITINSNDPSCWGLNDGDATVSASGGAGGHSFLWDSGSTNATLTNLSSGSYCVTATDVNGCEDSTACVTLNNPAVISLSTSQNNIDCHGVADGDATANASGGAGGFSYQWDSFAGAQTSPTATGLAAGIYCVTVSDANTCTASTCVTITEPSAITVSNVTLNDPSCAGFNDGDATVNASGGASGFSYLWDVSTGGQTGATATGLTAGVYCVTAVDANTCTALHCVTLSDPFWHYSKHDCYQ